MSESRTDLMLEMLKGIQQDVADIRREQVCQGIRLATLEAMMAELTK